MAIFSLFKGSKWRRRPWYRELVHQLQLQTTRTTTLRDTGLKMLKDVASDAVQKQFLEDFDRRAEEYWNEDAVVKGVFHRDDPASGAVWSERSFADYAKLYVTLEQREAFKVFYGSQLRKIITPLVEAGYLDQEVAEQSLDRVINGSNLFTSIDQRAKTLNKQLEGLIQRFGREKIAAQSHELVQKELQQEQGMLQKAESRAAKLAEEVEEMKARIAAKRKDTQSLRQEMDHEEEQWKKEQQSLAAQRDQLIEQLATLQRREQERSLAARRAAQDQAQNLAKTQAERFLQDKFESIMAGLSRDAAVSGLQLTPQELHESAVADMQAFLRDHPELDQNWIPEQQSAHQN